MISSVVSRVSAGFLVATGLPLLFAADVVLPRLVPGLPTSASWMGQLLAAGWLSIAAYNWNARATLLGGIYGRPAVNLNLVVYFVSALTLLKAGQVTPDLRLWAVPFGLLAGVYAILLFRGPFDRPEAR